VTTITQLMNVIGIQAMVGPCPSTPVAVVDSLAPVPCALEHHGTPGLEFRAVVCWVNLPWWWFDGAGIEGTQPRGKGAQLGHRVSLPFARDAYLCHMRSLPEVFAIRLIASRWWVVTSDACSSLNTFPFPQFDDNHIDIAGELSQQRRSDLISQGPKVNPLALLLAD
jgi:hypothetical protein